MIQKQVRVGERGQIVIPKEIRDKEGIEPQQILTIVDVAGNISIKPPAKKQMKNPEQRILEILSEAKLTEEDWKEIEKERDEGFEP